MTKVLFVCLGNICRSPTAEGVFLHLLKQQNITDRFTVDSAGTSGWHVGESADPRSRNTAKQFGFDLLSRSRKITVSDFDRFDYIIAMDRSNHRDIIALTSNEEHRNKVHMFRDFDPKSPANSEVPDPYYGGPQGFQNVFDICFAASRGLLSHINQSNS